jgi:hypothetical protein
MLQAEPKGKEIPALFGSLERQKLNHWTEIMADMTVGKSLSVLGPPLGPITRFFSFCL